MAILTNILAVIPSVKFIQSVFPSLVETAVTKKLLSVKMLEREGLVEEPGQDKGTDKVKEGTVEEDGTHLAPFDFTIIGTTGQEHHV